MHKEAVKVILVMGKSGSGKQPRIDCLSEEFGFLQISTGNLFRERIGLFNSIEYQDSVKSVWDDLSNSFKSDDEIIKLFSNNSKHPEKIVPSKHAAIVLGAKAKFYVESGLFCPDSLTNDIFKNAFEYYLNCPLEMCGSRNRGVILDGFPRTQNQLEFLVKLLSSHSWKIDFVLEVDLDDETIIRRTTGRRICPACQSVFHLMFIPPRDGKFCTKCEGDVLVKQRADDSTEALLRKRLAEFQEKVAPLLDVIREKYKIPFVIVSGNLPDPSRTAVRKDVMNNVSVLFAMDELLEQNGVRTPTPNLANCISYLTLNGVTAPIGAPRLIHIPSSSSLSSLMSNPSAGSSPPSFSPQLGRSPSFTSTSPSLSSSPSSTSPLPVPAPARAFPVPSPSTPSSGSSPPFASLTAGSVSSIPFPSSMNLFFPSSSIPIPIPIAPLKSHTTDSPVAQAQASHREDEKAG